MRDVAGDTRLVECSANDTVGALKAGSVCRHQNQKSEAPQCPAAGHLGAYIVEDNRGGSRFVEMMRGQQAASGLRQTGRLGPSDKP